MAISSPRQEGLPTPAAYPTLASDKANGHRLFFYCEGRKYCPHSKEIPVDDLIAKYGPDYQIRTPGSFLNRMKCSRCGHVGATVKVSPTGSGMMEK